VPTTWPILADPLSAPIVTGVVTRSPSGEVFESGISARGLLRPFRRDRKADFISASGTDLIASNIGQILGTICAGDFTSGELPWRTEFGSLLQVLRLRNNSPALAEQARVFVARAIERWEKRARIRAVTVSRTPEQNTLVLSIRWDIVDTGDRTFVIVPGLETEIALG
jgi:phage baseplate assembly protein W